jgi:hypothetical protein
MGRNDIRFRRNLVQRGTIHRHKDFHQFERMYRKRRRKNLTVKFLLIIIVIILLLSAVLALGGTNENIEQPELIFENTEKIL